MNRILKGSPWLFRNSWLLLRRWERNMNLLETYFSIVEIWVQIWGIPEHCKTVKLGMKIVAILGEVRDCALFELGGSQSRIIKALVNMKINTPIRKGVNMGSKEDGLAWVDFKYERLPTFCYFCGVVGHDENSCDLANGDENSKRKRSKELGPWLRAE